MSRDQITNGVKRQDEECVMPSSNGCATNKSTMTDTAMSSPLTKFLPKPQKVIKIMLKLKIVDGYCVMSNLNAFFPNLGIFLFLEVWIDTTIG